jgi:LuxR family maltose regulon positive regulatory protein
MAAQYLVEGIDRCAQVGYILDQIVGQVTLARVQMAQDDWDAAQTACLNANKLSQKMRGYLYARRWAEDCRVRLWLAQCPTNPGCLRKAARWANQSGLGIDDDFNFLHDLAHITLARVLVAQGRADLDARHLADAQHLLNRLLETAVTAGWMGKVLEILVLQALAYQGQGQVEEALKTLERAFSLAEPEGYFRIFLDEGQPMARLLYKAAEQGIVPGYTGRLLAAFPAGEPAVTHTPLHTGSPAMVEPLSKRELEVLQLIVAGATNAEIAQELYIALNTTKNHVKNIYGKLAVHSRAQAIARSRELGLIE